MSTEPSNKEKSDLLGLIKKIPGHISSIVAFFTLVIGAILGLTNWFGGNPITAIYIAAIAFLLIVWEISLYIYFTKTITKSYSALKGKQIHKQNAFSRMKRHIALTVAVVLTGIATFCALYWRPIKPPPSNKTIILIADFQSLDGQNYGVTEKIIEQLRDATKSFPNIEVQSLKQTITTQEGSEVARTIATEKQAIILLWGLYRKTQENVWITSHIEIMQKPINLHLKGEKEELTLPVKGIESFQIQTQLSQELTYLTLLTIGLTRYEVGDGSGAVNLFNKALSQNAVPEQMINPADIYFFRGTAYLGMSDYDRAIADYKESLRITPDNFCALCAHTNLGIAYIFKREYDAAILNFNQALNGSRGSDDNALIHYYLGIAYESKNDYDHAIVEYEESISQKASAVTYERLGTRYHMKGETDKALAAFNEALKLNPEHGATYNSRGITYSIIGDYEKAIADFTQALKFSPESAITYTNRGNAFLDKGDFSSALTDFNTSLAINPKNPVVFYSRGYLLLAQKNYEKAIEDFNKALSLESDYAEVYHHRGIAFQMLGYNDKAITDYRRFLDIASDRDYSSHRYAHELSHIDVIKRLKQLNGNQ